MLTYSPNCIMMLPTYARRVTTDVWSTKKKIRGMLHLTAGRPEHYIGILTAVSSSKQPTGGIS